MSSEGSVTLWITLAKDGDSAAVDALWQRYFPKLVRLARKKLAGGPRRAADEEDVAQSAFKSFCLAAERGRFPDLAGRDSIWRLLLQMTARKAIDLRRHEGRQRRSVKASRGSSSRSDRACLGRESFSLDSKTNKHHRFFAAIRRQAGGGWRQRSERFLGVAVSRSKLSRPRHARSDRWTDSRTVESRVA
jgi:DNA-directed RNA polymerase specialized sigma24 family protein